MSEARRNYRVTSLSIETLNRTLALVADRLDELEGARGTPTFRADVEVGGHRVRNLAAGTESGDALTAGQVADLELTSLSGNLPQDRTHDEPDTDAAAASLHHTLGTTALQAAAGDRGVTNGDAHNHAGGAGAQIAYSSLSGAPGVTISGSGTLDAAATTTTVSNGAAVPGSKIMLTATSAAFVALGPWVSSKGTGSFVVSHALSAGTETFDYAIL